MGTGFIRGSASRISSNGFGCICLCYVVCSLQVAAHSRNRMESGYCCHRGGYFHWIKSAGNKTGQTPKTSGVFFSGSNWPADDGDWVILNIEWPNDSYRAGNPCESLPG